MSKLILPGDVPARGGLTIHVPRGYETERELHESGEAYMVCTVIVDADGGLCGQTFQEGEERLWQKHVGDCALEHIDHIRAASPRTRMPILDPANWDPEIEEHMRGVGRRMLEEGRWEVKKSERAGF